MSHAIREQQNNSSPWCFTHKKEQIIWMKLHKMVLFGHYIVIEKSPNISKAQRKVQQQSNAARTSFKGNFCGAVIITVPSQPCSLCFCLDWWLCCSPLRSSLDWSAALYSVCKKRKMIQLVFMTNTGLLYDVKSRAVFMLCIIQVLHMFF